MDIFLEAFHYSVKAVLILCGRFPGSQQAAFLRCVAFPSNGSVTTQTFGSAAYSGGYRSRFSRDSLLPSNLSIAEMALCFLADLSCTIKSLKPLFWAGR